MDCICADDLIEGSKFELVNKIIGNQLFNLFLYYYILYKRKLIKVCLCGPMSMAIFVIKL